MSYCCSHEFSLDVKDIMADGSWSVCFRWFEFLLIGMIYQSLMECFDTIGLFSSIPKNKIQMLIIGKKKTTIFFTVLRYVENGHVVNFKVSDCI